MTRIIGDKVHSVIEKRNRNELEETEEHFQNFDHDKLDEFNKEWNGYNNRQPEPNGLNFRNEQNNFDNKNSWVAKLFSKFF